MSARPEPVLPIIHTFTRSFIPETCIETLCQQLLDSECNNERCGPGPATCPPSVRGHSSRMRLGCTGAWGAWGSQRASPLGPEKGCREEGLHPSSGPGAGEAGHGRAWHTTLSRNAHPGSGAPCSIVTGCGLLPILRKRPIWAVRNNAWKLTRHCFPLIPAQLPLTSLGQAGQGMRG